MVGGRGVPTDRGNCSGAGISAGSVGPDQEDEAALICASPTRAPQGHPNTRRQLGHSLASPKTS